MANLTFDDICGMLREKVNFSFSRWGDGEWSAALGREGRNCDGHPYFADMSLSLAAILLEPQTHYMGMQPKAMEDMGDEINAWMERHGCSIDWCVADVIHDASIAGRLNELHSALKRRQVLMVAPPYLAPVAQSLSAHHIICPPKNVWKFYDAIYDDIAGSLDRDTVVIYVASMPSNVLIAQFAREYQDTITQIDIGSAFDPYVGVQTRRYHKDIIERVINGQGNKS